MPEPAHVKRLNRALAALRDLDDPLHRLDAARRAREEVERLELEAVSASRRAGLTWTQIGALYGLTKQGAQQRFRQAGPTKGAPAQHPPTGQHPTAQHPTAQQRPAQHPTKQHPT